MLFELTLTLKPFMYSLNCKDQFAHTKNLVRGALQGRKYTGIAELTKANNVHYHIMIEVEGSIDRDNIINRFRSCKQFGKYTFEGVTFIESFKKYIIKALKETGVFFDPVIHDDYNLTVPISNNKYIIVRSPNGSGVKPSGVEVPQSRIAPPLAVRNSDPELKAETIRHDSDISEITSQKMSDIRWYNTTRKEMPLPSNNSV